MIRNPSLKVTHHRSKDFVIQDDVVSGHAEDLRPAFATRSTDGKFDIIESLVDLAAEIGRVVTASSRIPTT